MTDARKHQVHFAPPAKGTGWPYAVLLLIGAGICAYLAVDLYLLFAGYERAPSSDYIFVAALAGLALAFVAGAWAFWYFPWSWASLTVDGRGVEVSVRGMGAMPRVLVRWEELSSISVMVLPRQASTLGFRTGEGLSKTLRAAALEDGLDKVVQALAERAAQAGYQLEGARVAVPVLGGRTWQVVRRS